MIWNYIKISLRNLARHKTYSFINIFGLSIGMAFFILIVNTVYFDLNCEDFNTNFKEIMKINWLTGEKKQELSNELIPPSLISAMKSELPEIKDVTCFDDLWSASVASEIEIGKERLAIADASFFRIFTVEFINGNPINALNEPNSVVITDQTARKYFGHSNPVGKKLKIFSRFELKITGIIKSFPAKSYFQFGLLTSPDTIPTQRFADGRPTFILTQKGTSIDELTQKMEKIKRQWCSVNFPGGMNHPIQLLPLSNLNFFQTEKNPNFIYIRAFLLFSALLLLLACVNFTVLSTALYTNRAREIGLRKILGASRFKVIMQFICESMIITAISSFFAMSFSEMLLPFFAPIQGKEFYLNYSSPEFILGLLAFILCVGIAAGSYPAIYLSSLKPSLILSFKGKTARSHASSRRILIIIQLSISIFFILCFYVSNNIIDVLFFKPSGFDKENIFYIPLRAHTVEGLELFKKNLSRFPAIERITTVSDMFIANALLDAGSDIYIENPERRERRYAENTKPRRIMPKPGSIFNMLYVGDHFLETFKIKLTQGRDFSSSNPEDVNNFILNQTAVKQMKLTHPIGKKLTIHNKTGIIIGIVENFNYDSIFYEVQPLVIGINPSEMRYLVLGIKPEKNSNGFWTFLDLKKTINDLYQKAFPGKPFKYIFQLHHYMLKYKGDFSLGRLATFYTVLAILISLLGILALTSFMAQQKKKEIAIRKVIGSSTSKISFLFAREFGKMVLISNFIAWAPAYWSMKLWVERFPTGTQIDFGVFLYTGLGSLIVVTFIVCFISIKASRQNPVDTLRNE